MRGAVGRGWGESLGEGCVPPEVSGCAGTQTPWWTILCCRGQPGPETCPLFLCSCSADWVSQQSGQQDFYKCLFISLFFWTLKAEVIVDHWFETVTLPWNRPPIDSVDTILEVSKVEPWDGCRATIPPLCNEKSMPLWNENTGLNVQVADLWLQLSGSPVTSLGPLPRMPHRFLLV